MKCGSGEIHEAWSKPLYDGFEDTAFSASGGLYFKNNPEQNAGTVEFQNDIAFRGKGAVKLCVRAVSNWQEQGLTSQRAEIWERQDLWVPYNRGVWYGFAVKFAEPVPQDDHTSSLSGSARFPAPRAILAPFLPFG